MIIANIDGRKMQFRSEASLIAFQSTPRKPSESCSRVRRLRKREKALKFYFGMILRGRLGFWAHVNKIYAVAPQLCERVAKELKVTETKFEKCNATKESS